MFPVGFIGRRVTTHFPLAIVFQYVAAKILVQCWIRDDRLATNSREMCDSVASLDTTLFNM